MLCLIAAMLPVYAAGGAEQQLYYKYMDVENGEWVETGDTSSMENFRLNPFLSIVLKFCDADGNLLTETPRIENPQYFTVSPQPDAANSWQLQGAAPGQTKISITHGGTVYSSTITCVLSEGALYATIRDGSTSYVSMACNSTSPVSFFYYDSQGRRVALDNTSTISLSDAALGEITWQDGTFVWNTSGCAATARGNITATLPDGSTCTMPAWLDASLPTVNAYQLLVSGPNDQLFPGISLSLGGKTQLTFVIPQGSTYVPLDSSWTVWCDTSIGSVSWQRNTFVWDASGCSTIAQGKFYARQGANGHVYTMDGRLIDDGGGSGNPPVDDSKLYYRAVSFAASGSPQLSESIIALPGGFCYVGESITLQFCDSTGSVLTGDIAVGEDSICSVQPRTLTGIADAYEITWLYPGQTIITLTSADGEVYQSQISVLIKDGFTRATFVVGGSTYAVAFGSEYFDGMETLLDLTSPETAFGPTADYERQPSGSYSDGAMEYGIYLGKEKIKDGTSIYEKTDDFTLTVKSVSITATYGDALTFSLSDRVGRVTMLSSPSSSGIIYYNKAYSGLATLTAVVEISSGAVTTNTREYTVNLTFAGNATETVNIDCTNAATIQAVNEILSAAAADATHSDKVVIRLGAKEYRAGADGVTNITIPNLTNYWQSDAVHILGSEAGGTRTKIVGGLVLDNSKQGGCVEGIDFVAPTAGRGTALSAIDRSDPAGPLDVVDCSFSGYAVAIDCTKSFIRPSYGNTFTGNTVAVHVALGGFPVSFGDWRANRFVQNGTAIRVDSFSESYTPYHFRLSDSDFIGNTVDFNITPTGNFYFYRNYFQTGAPVVKTGTTMPICYPTRANSIQSGDDTLFFGGENTVLNDIADELIVADVPDDAKIDVVEDDGSADSDPSTIATWQF